MAGQEEVLGCDANTHLMHLCCAELRAQSVTQV